MSGLARRRGPGGRGAASTCDFHVMAPELPNIHLGPLDDARLDDALPTARVYKEARASFKAGVQAFDEADGHFTEAACAGIADALLNEARAIEMWPFYSRVDDAYEAEGMSGVQVVLAPLLAYEFEGTPAEVNRNRAVVVSACMRAFVGRWAEHASEPVLVVPMRQAEDQDEKYTDKARNATPDDPRVWRWSAGRAIRLGDTRRAVKELRRSVELARKLGEDDPRRVHWFSALYTLATVRYNEIPERGTALQKKGHLREVLELLDEFLQHAPDCHHFSANAAFWRSTLWVKMHARASGSSPKELARAHPAEVERMAALHARGVGCVALHRRHFALQPKTQQHADAEGLMHVLRGLGAVPSVPRVPNSCWGPDCENDGPSTCSGCRVAGYCSQRCQRAHWKGGHKHECAELRTQRARKEEIMHEADAERVQQEARDGDGDRNGFPIAGKANRATAKTMARHALADDG